MMGLNDIGLSIVAAKPIWVNRSDMIQG